MKNVIFSIILVFLTLSCNEISDKREEVFKIKTEIKGQAFLIGNNISVEYSPRGSFIEVVPSQHRFWKNVRLFQNKKEFISKDFFSEGENTILFDSLNNCLLYTSPSPRDS